MVARRRRWRRRALAQARWYDQAIVIDALGGVGDPYAPEEQLRLSDRAWTETVATGVTVVRDTVCRSATSPTAGATIRRHRRLRPTILNANPDAAAWSGAPPTSCKAKREKKFGVVLGTQDTSMVGPELDRLAQ